MTPRASDAEVVECADRLIRETRDPEAAVTMSDAWDERCAIATIDGGLPLREAELVALEELVALAAEVVP